MEMLNAAYGGVAEERERRRAKRRASYRVMERARSLVLVAACVLAAAWAPVPVDAACAAICSNDVWGFGPSPSFTLCECSDAGKQTGPNCGCGPCLIAQSNKYIGFAKVNGVCEAGYTDCTGCLESTDSGSDSGSGKTNTTTTKTPTPSSTKTPATDSPSTTLTPSSSTPSGNSSSTAGNSDALPSTEPSVTPASASNTPSASATVVPIASSSSSSLSSSAVASGSRGSVNNLDGNAGTPSTTSSGSGSNTGSGSSGSSGIATWQIALIICSCVLVFAVIISTIMSCYCRARNQMKDNLAIEEDAAEYTDFWNPKDIQEDDNQYNNNGSFGPAMSQPGRTSFSSPHSRPSSGRNLPFVEPTYAIDNTDRIVRTNRQSLGSNGDLPGLFSAFPRERPSHEVGSRKNIAIEL